MKETIVWGKTTDITCKAVHLYAMNTKITAGFRVK